MDNAAPVTGAEHAPLSGIPDGAQPLALAAMLAEKGATGTLIYVARDEGRMETVRAGVEFFAPDAEVLTFPAWDCLPYDRVSPNHTVTSRRIETLTRLAHLTPSPVEGGSGWGHESHRSSGNAPLPSSPLLGEGKKHILLTTVNALLQRVPPREVIAGSSFSIAAGQDVDREALLGFLIRNGYGRVGKVMEPGEFALRGNIIDLFPPGMELGLRLDLFGDTLETIRTFDPLTQVSSGTLARRDLMPVSELLLGEERIERFRNRYRETFGAVTKQDPLYEAVSEGRKYAGMEHWLPLFYESLDTLLDYLPNAPLVFDHLALEARDERLELIQDFYDTRTHTNKLTSQDAPYHPLPPSSLYLTAEEWDACIGAKRALWFSAYKEEQGTSPYATARDFAPERVQTGLNIFEAVKAHVAERSASGRKVLISCFSEGARDRMHTMLEDHGMVTQPLNAWAAVKKLTPGVVGLAVLPLEHGFETDTVTLLSEQDILGERIIRAPKRKKKSGTFLLEAASLLEGEYVVHKEHGIGRFEGLETVTAGGAPHDCLKLVYLDGDRLFVPVENSEVVSRYGAEDAEVKLDKLGGVAWQARKARLKEKIKLAAEALLKIAAERILQQAPALEPAAGIYDEFCARFPYPETDDQLRAIEDVTEDLARGRPADRLICGDVGFGKTEVALRAAMIACQGGGEGGVRSQVAVITPTTLLCRQHYQTFRERFAGLGIEIRQLSRLVSAKEAGEVKAKLKEGKVDIVIGTHALLGKGVEFKNLTLLIVDEEQHFGVAQKERIKQLKANVHVITLSATPIPRTLQMALTGVKDLSLIATPPIDRLAVRTFVMPFDPVVIREAILREHYRGGKIFYVCPRIADLAEVTHRIKELVPEIKTRTVHGQMPPHELDDIVNAFYDGAFDMLISTNIVESGLDVPTANTIIIHRADMFGLGQLYQLRGRVGRGKIRAYAYLTLPYRKTPSKAALKRLEVMQTLDTLGAGFSLATHDMDIRGCGNLLGEEQSGHVKEVGVELYQQMLEEAVGALSRREREGGEGMSPSGAPHAEDWSPQINLGLAVLIPEAYVADLALRMGLYKRLSMLENKADIDSFAGEMVDRFGPLPEEVKNLLAIMEIKQLCRSAGIEKVDAGPKGAVITFRNNQFGNPAALITLMQKQPGVVKIRPDQKLVFMHDWPTPAGRLSGTRKALQTIVAL